MNRKPKSVVIRHEDEDDEVDIPALNTALTDKKKKKRNKIKVIHTEEQLDDIDEIKIPTRKAQKKLQIPLFDIDGEETVVRSDWKDVIGKKEEKTPTATDNDVEMIDEEDDGPVIVDLDSKPTENKEEEFISLEESAPPKSKTFTPRLDEHIDDADEEDYIDEEVAEKLNDGRLPLSEKEASIQKKLQEMEIKEALYDLEISDEDEEVHDWTTQKVKQGGMATQKRDVKKKTKLTVLPDDTLDQQKRQIDEIIEVLKVREEEQRTLQTQLETRREDLKGQLNTVKNDLEELGKTLV